MKLAYLAALPAALATAAAPLLVGNYSRSDFIEDEPEPGLFGECLRDLCMCIPLIRQFIPRGHGAQQFVVRQALNVALKTEEQFLYHDIRRFVLLALTNLTSIDSHVRSGSAADAVLVRRRLLEEVIAPLNSALSEYDLLRMEYEGEATAPLDAKYDVKKLADINDQLNAFIAEGSIDTTRWASLSAQSQAGLHEASHALHELEASTLVGRLLLVCKSKSADRK